MSERNYSLTIGWLYPDLMSTYGDRGNLICLQKRCEWRGIKVKVEEISLGTEDLKLKACDLLLMGGAQDRQQKIAAEDLRKNKGPVIREMIENGFPGLFVCAAYQFMGHFYRPANGEEIEGLHVFDLYTQHFGKNKPRCIGNIVIRVQSSEFRVQSYVIGFENHGGRTYLGKKVKPFGQVVVGYGNNGEDGLEGCLYKNSFGTYLHGPILPKNPHLADHLIKTALFKKYGNEVKLDQLDDNLEWQAHKFMLRKLKIS